MARKPKVWVLTSPGGIAGVHLSYRDARGESRYALSRWGVKYDVVPKLLIDPPRKPRKKS